MRQHEYKLAVIGDPISHSLSPIMHAGALQAAGLNGTYEAIHVRPADLPDAIHRLKQDGYDGFNVTIPHKEAIIPLLDQIDDVAIKVGAVNTVVRRGDSLIGYNTDVTGFGRIIDSLRLRPATAVVLGAGGSARAVVAALLDRFQRVMVANRTLERADALAALRPSSPGPFSLPREKGSLLSKSADSSSDCGTPRLWDTAADVRNWPPCHLGVEGKRERGQVLPLSLSRADLAPYLAEADLLINTTSVGMNAPDESPLPRGLALRQHTVVCDLVYKPLETALLRQARARGCRTVDGLEMLVAQGADSLALWTGIRPDEAVMTAAITGDVVAGTPVAMSVSQG